MRSCASAAKLRGGVPILCIGTRAIGCGGWRHLGWWSAGSVADSPKLSCGRVSIGRGQAAARRAMPSGTVPVVAKRHKAISNLRARATIIVLRVPLAVSVRAWYHFARALSP
jgi:hypothetical protein